MVINYLDSATKFKKQYNEWALGKLQEWEVYEFIKSHKAEDNAFDWLLNESNT